ncbi:extensin [Iris pallida]|uniref:Extensin n=1 Tax=Iris pallida TaxID=29817 RepID=A0AAX6FHS6_IRIPA|nr:extensin [Iris pallida]
MDVDGSGELDDARSEGRRRWTTAAMRVVRSPIFHSFSLVCFGGGGGVFWSVGLV